MRKIAGILLLFFIAISLLPVASAIPQPQGVGGVVRLNNVAINGIQVSLININTGETKTTTTQKNEQNQNGFYAATFTVMLNDVIRITVIYNDKLYSNSARVTQYIPTLWLNLYINATSEPPDGGDNHTPPPDEHGNHPPQANFTYLPLHPFVNDTVVFRDNSRDSDNDIISWTWTIDGDAITGKYITYAFTQPGNHIVSLVVLDVNNSMSIKQKTVPVFFRNGTLPVNQTQNLTIHFQIVDKNSNKIHGATVEIYVGTELYMIVHTNKTGMVQTILPPGTYKIKAYYGNMENMETYTFANDETVVFLLSQKNTPVPQSTDYMLFIIIGIICIVSTISILVIGRLKQWI